MAKGAAREFRGSESLFAEQISRDAIAPFLSSRGFVVSEDQRIQTGTAVQQLVSAISPDGERLRMRVRLCWRREGRNANERLFSAAQLQARLRPGGWDATLAYIVDRDRQHGITHNLIVQRDGSFIVYAALVPVEAITPIWKRQSEVSDELLRAGQLGRLKKNHARNGSSPTVWLQDDRRPAAHNVADVLWMWPGVLDLVGLPALIEGVDDTFDDCPVSGIWMYGRDEGTRVSIIRSAIRRDPKVRREVHDRANGCCERQSCRARRDFSSFLDIHHILGVDNSDRPWTCVALCPNCHREAHYAPNADELNQELLEYASQFK